MVLLSELKKKRGSNDTGSQSRVPPGNSLERDRNYVRFVKLPTSLLNEPATGSAAKPTKETLNAELLDAVEARNLNAVKRALDGGADPNTKGFMGRSVWNIADGNGYGEIADELKSRGAITAPDEPGREIPDSTVQQLCIKSLLQTPQPPAAPSLAAEPPMCLTPAPVGAVSEDGDDEAGIYRFGALRRTLRELASSRMTALYTGLMAGILGLAAAHGISNKIDEHRSAKAEMVGRKAPEASARAEKPKAPITEQELRANNKKLIDAVRGGDEGSAWGAYQDGVSREAVNEARRLAALGKNEKMLKLTYDIRERMRVLDPDQAKPQYDGKNENNADLIRAAHPVLIPRDTYWDWKTGPIKRALSKGTSKEALSDALLTVTAYNPPDRLKPARMEIAYLIAQRMEPMAEPGAKAEGKPKDPQQAEPKEASRAQPVPKTPGASLAPGEKQELRGSYGINMPGGKAAESQHAATARGRALTPGEKQKLREELGDAMKRDDGEAVNRILKKAGLGSRIPTAE